MNGQALQSTKRELHALLSNRRVLIGVGAAGVITGLAGPFGTGDYLGLLARLAYWLVLCFGTFLTGSLLIGPGIRALMARGLPRMGAALVAAVLAGLVITAEVALLNWVVFALPPTDPAYLADVALNGVIISAVITLAALFLADEAPADPPPSGATRPAPALLTRLPLEKRGALVSLTVQDHYVEVVTTKGRDLVLMRLTDAIRETDPTPGLQVHRSHWVATDQVRSARRDGARAVLTLGDGRDIPVSRSNVAAVKEAGLLPG